LQVETENNVVQNMLASVKKSGRLRDLMESYEARLIKETLAACQWNQTKTAVELKIARRTLVEKINKYGIQRKA
jgi:two-component system response regulator HupR/HoxA